MTGSEDVIYLRVNRGDGRHHVAYDETPRVLVGRSSCTTCWGRGWVMVTHIAGRPDRGRQLCHCVRPEQ